ncbi:uncharacterized protein [Salminus brasiliensis]|uniref:uncharacterized protein n=1 Tax=Salminus brasiliensis TaxID=930266 RepID=UPI003B834369
MRCVCRAEAEPRASVSWTANESLTLLPHYKTLTNYTGRVAVSELTGPLTHGVSCKATNYLGYDTCHMSVQHPPSGVPPTILLDSACSEWAGGMRCVCRAEAEPRASVSWTANGSLALLPHYKTLTNYTGRVAVSELTGPLTHGVSCKATNYLGNDTCHMSVQHPPSGGTVGMIVAAVLFAVLGIGVTALCFKKRSGREPSEIRTNKYTNDNVCINESIYMNDTDTETDIYTNTMEHRTTKDNMEDIYENY